MIVTVVKVMDYHTESISIIGAVLQGREEDLSDIIEKFRIDNDFEEDDIETEEVELNSLTHYVTIK